MKEQTKYVTLQEVVDEYIKKRETSPIEEHCTFSGIFSMIQDEGKIVTEDAEFEIIEPKQIENKNE